MRVRALAKGFYGRYLTPGDEFDLADEADLGSWMVPVNESDFNRVRDRLSKQALAYRKGDESKAVPPTTGPAHLRDPIGPERKANATETEAPATTEPEKSEPETGGTPRGPVIGRGAGGRK